MKILYINKCLQIFTSLYCSRPVLGIGLSQFLTFWSYFCSSSPLITLYCTKLIVPFFELSSFFSFLFYSTAYKYYYFCPSFVFESYYMALFSTKLTAGKTIYFSIYQGRAKSLLRRRLKY